MGIRFTAGITLNSGEVFTADVEGIDDEGLRYTSEGVARVAFWRDIKAVMLATTDHMLETGGYLFSMAEMVREQDQRQPYDAQQMRRFGLDLLTQAAPRICPLADECGLAPRPSD